MGNMVMVIDEFSLRVATLAGVVVALCGSSACLGPNPYLVDDDGTDDGDSVGTNTDTAGDGDGDATGDGDGDSSGDGDGDPLPETCSNRALDPDESDVDCGGRCSPCADGDACGVALDCASQVCSGATCQAPTCADAVHNGDELDVDCGGSACGFCQLGPLVLELDDFEGSDAANPRVAMFDDGSFALSYHGPIEVRARWFGTDSAALGPSIELDPDLDFVGPRAIPIAAGTGSDHPIHAIEAGTDAVMATPDLFLIRATADGPTQTVRVNAEIETAIHGDLSVEDKVATVSWIINNKAVTRRFDYAAANGSWTDIDPFDADPLAATFDGTGLAVNRNSSGLAVVAWERCADGQWPCDIAVRRFDDGWVDADPITAPSLPDGLAGVEPRVAIAEDGRVAVLIRTLGLEHSGLAAWIVDADGVSEGTPWVLQTEIPHEPDVIRGDVAALSDGSFLFAWPDPGQDRVHLRRYLGTELPKLPSVGDESPWATIDTPSSTSLATIDGRVVVVWAATVDGIRQVQGQVLGY